MKRCPECRRDYYDDTLLYCLEDGNALVQGSVPSPDGPATAILPSSSAPGEDPTRAQIHTTEQTAVLPRGAEAEPQENLSDSTEKQNFSANRAAKPLITVAAAVVLLVGGFFGYRYFGIGGSAAINSIAVMPFENRNSDADTDYLSDGLAESVIYRLSQIPDLKVSPTSSVFRYKGKETDPQVVAKELGVDSVMTGRITQRADNLTISVNLVDTRNGKSLWGEQYERKLSDLLTTQREIVTEIVSKLQLKLSGESEQKLAKKYTDNNEAYQLYLQGRYHWNKRQTKEFERAIVFFKQAIEKDPNYALAYSGLADSYSQFPTYGNFRPKDYLPQAKQSALKSLELDPNLAEAHTSLAQIVIHYDYDFAGAERSYKRAIELDPNYATAHQWYAELLSWSGRDDEGIREIAKAIELDPFSFAINLSMAIQLQRAGRFEEALLQNKKFNELFPDVAGFHLRNGNVYADQGKYDEAVEEYLNSSRANKDFKPENIAKLKEAYEKGGWDGYRRSRQDIRIEELNAQHGKAPNVYVRAMNFASAYALGKDKDKTIEYLNKAYDERERQLLLLKVTKTWDFVRDDPRFKELVKRVGIPE
ncbi:MAG: tetratricopeptide repeat protein [Pyrinomonadaceae bacterium]